MNRKTVLGEQRATGEGLARGGRIGCGEDNANQPSVSWRGLGRRMRGIVVVLISVASEGGIRKASTDTRAAIPSWNTRDRPNADALLQLRDADLPYPDERNG